MARITERKYTSDGTEINGAVSCNKDVTFLLEADRSEGIYGINLILRPDSGQKRTYPLMWEKHHLGRETWKVSLSSDSLPVGLFFYKYQISLSVGEKYFGGEESEILTEDRERQLLVYENTFREKLRGAVIYQIFTDRFRKSGRCVPKQGCVMNDDWDNGIPQYGAYPGAEVKNNEFFGGDLYGICEKLDYIKSLGVDYIYLCPVFEAYSNHKYDTGDYLTVDSMFGGDGALKSLVESAKNVGIGIILDGVFNHTGDDSIYFNKYGNYESTGAYQSRESEYSSWYTFRNFPEDYECWWGVKILPRVNSSCEAYKRFITNDVVNKWMDMGVAGWRLDVCDELSDGFLCEFRDSIRRKNPDSFVIGEVWEDATNKVSYGNRRSYLQGAQLDSVMNYPFRNAVISYVRDGDFESFANVVNGICRRYPKEVLDSLMNFLGTHDTERIITVLGGASSEGKTNAELAVERMTEAQYERARKLLILAYRMISFLPGALSVYYGDEVGLQGYRDPFCRRPFPWGREDKTILDEVRRVLRDRKESELLSSGDFRILEINPEYAVLQRYNKNSSKSKESALCIINRSEKQFTFACDTEFYVFGEKNKPNLGELSLPRLGAVWLYFPNETVSGEYYSIL